MGGGMFLIPVGRLLSQRDMFDSTWPVERNGLRGLAYEGFVVCIFRIPIAEDVPILQFT